MTKPPTQGAIEMRDAQQKLKNRQIADLMGERTNAEAKIAQINADLEHIGYAPAKEERVPKNLFSGKKKIPAKKSGKKK